MTRNRLYLTIVGGVVLVAVAYWIFFRPTPIPTPPDPTVPTPEPTQIVDIFAYNRELARAIHDRYPDPDVAAVAIEDDPPIGTLYLPGRSYESNDHSCVPAELPQARASNAFASYRGTSGIFAALGLNSGVIKGLDKAGATVDQNQEVLIHFNDQSRIFLDDDRLHHLLEQPDCVAALAGKPFEMVRGYYRARRAFQLSASVKSAFDLDSIAEFNAKRVSQSAVELSDPAPMAVVQLRSLISIAPATPTMATPTPMPIPAATGAPSPLPTQGTLLTVANPGVAKLASRLNVTLAHPFVLTNAGMVFIQRDSADTSGRGDRAVALVRGLGLRVAGKVEAIESRKMPGRGEVRYFNPGDEALARRVAAALGEIAVFAVKPIPLAAPSGQLEIWLPKAGVSAALPKTMGMVATLRH